MGRPERGLDHAPDFSDDAWLKRGSITLPECNPMQWEGVTRMEDSRGLVIIVGAGVAGLTAGYLLARKGFKIVVIEKEDRVGGLARSFYYDNFFFDIGPHRFHTDDKAVQAFVEEVLGENKIVLPRSSGVWMFEAYHDWPLNWEIIFKLPPLVIIKIIFDLFTRSTVKENNFEDYIINKYGRTLYNVFFKPYTEKFLKIPCNQVHRNWAETGIDRAVIDKKVKMGNLREVIKTSLFPRSVKTNFLYPANGGIDMFSNNLAEAIKKQGGEIHLNTTIDKIETEASSIKCMHYQNTCLHPDMVIWTAPLTALLNLLHLDPSPIRYLSTIIFNMEITGDPAIKYQWCYFGQQDTTINRISIPVLFSPLAAPHGETGICVEITCFEGDNSWNNPESFVQDVINDLLKVRVIKRSEEIKKIHIEKIPNTYPVYDTAYLADLDSALEQVGRFKKLKLLGRTGTFWYNNMDHSIAMAFSMVRDLLQANQKA